MNTDANVLRISAKHVKDSPCRRLANAEYAVSSPRQLLRPLNWRLKR